MLSEPGTSGQQAPRGKNTGAARERGGIPVRGRCYHMPMSIGFSIAPPLSAQSLKAPTLYTWL